MGTLGFLSAYAKALRREENGNASNVDTMAPALEYSLQTFFS
jgi:hypothetical protein